MSQPTPTATSMRPLLVIPIDDATGIPLVPLELVSDTYIFCVQAFNKPYDPSTCAAALIGCVATLIRAQCMLLMNAGANDHPVDLWLKFISTPRSTRQFSELIKTTTCRYSAEELSRPDKKLQLSMHQNAQSRYPQEPQSNFTVGLLVALILSNVTVMLGEPTRFTGGTALYKVKRRARRVRKHTPPGRSRQVWPDTPSRLLPHGPEDTVRGLLSWLDVDILEDKDAETILFLMTNLIKGTPTSAPLHHQDAAFRAWNSSIALLPGI